MTAPCPPYIPVKLKPWEKNPYKDIIGHPSHTDHDAPEGPDWWRRKGGWDKFAARLTEQTRELCHIIGMLQNTTGFREANFQKNASRVLTKIKRIKAEYAKMKLLAKKLERQNAELLARIAPVDEAIKRGALALDPHVWETYKKRERERLAREGTVKVKNYRTIPGGNKKVPVKETL